MSTATTNDTPTITAINNSKDEFETRRRIEIDVSRILKQLGIRPKLVGFLYLKTAIAMYYENPDYYSCFITKRLYIDVAKRHKVKSATVERNMRSAVSSMQCSDETKERILGYAADGYPNKDFIANVVEYMIYI